MQAAVIENGFVVNVIEVESLNLFPGLVDGAGARMGDAYDPETGAFSTPPPAPPPVPDAIDMRQAELMLVAVPHGEGTRLDAVNAYIATQPQKVQIEWRRASELRRDHPMVAIMALFFEQTEADVDQFFRDGAAIGPTLTL